MHAVDFAEKTSVLYIHTLSSVAPGNYNKMEHTTIY